jgi:pimeloyl-ACP methyl ester carboxylesterase
MTSARVAGPTGAIQIDDGGSGGVPVLFLHGFSGNSSHWAAQLDHLRPRRRAIAMNLRGHGGSDAPADGDFAVESQAADVLAVLDVLVPEPAVLVGHSLGGAVAIAVAGRNPTRVAGLVLASAPGRLPEEQATQVVGAMEADYEGTSAGYWNRLTEGATPDTLARIERERHDLDAATGLAIIRATFTFDPESLLRAYPGPKLAIVTPRQNAPHDLHNAVPGVPHRVIEGTSHFLQMDRPDEFNAILDEFLATVDAAGAGSAGG